MTPGTERRLGRHGRVTIPGADILADVTAEGPLADTLPELGGDRPTMLDRQIRDAAPGVEHVGANESPGGARVQAPCAGATAVWQGRVSLDLRRRQHGPDEEEGAEVRVEKHRVLADPAEAR